MIFTALSFLRLRHSLFFTRGGLCQLDYMRKTKKIYDSYVADNRHFWKIVKPILSDNLVHKENVTLSENGEKS